MKILERSASALFLLTLLVSCQTPQTARLEIVGPPPTPPVIAERQLFMDSRLSDANIGYQVFDLTTQTVVAQKNPRQGFIPASVTKLPTMLAALHILGPEFRFKTLLGFRGHVAKGVLNGDLHLKGNGDPFLMLSDLMNLVQTLRAKQISEVTGDFFFDDIEMVSQHKLNEVQSDEGVYNTSLSALASEFNRFVIHWSPDLTAGKLQVQAVPELPWIRIELNQTQDKRGRRFSFTMSEEAETWLISPFLKKDGSQELPVKSSSRFTAALFALLCRQSGISLKDPKPGPYPKRAKALGVHESPPLRDLVERVWDFSNNLMADLVTLTAAAKLSGKALPLREASGVIKSWLMKQIPDVDWQGFEMENGSGLTSRGRLTPEQMLAILRWGERQTYGGKTFISLLPVAGWKGSLKGQLVSPSTSLRVWAKTGTIDYARALSGYFFSKSNKMYLFAIFICDLEKRRKADETPATLPGNRDGTPNPASDEAEGWLTRAKAAETLLLTKWIQDS